MTASITWVAQEGGTAAVLVGGRIVTVLPTWRDAAGYVAVLTMRERSRLRVQQIANEVAREEYADAAFSDDDLERERLDRIPDEATS